MESPVATGNRQPIDCAQLPLARETPCYVALALTVRKGHALLVCLCSLAAAGPVGCGGGERQDANETEADYDVEVVDTSFPKRQRLGQSSELKVTVRNADAEAIPNIALTIDGFSRRVDDADLADPNRPVFIIDGEPRDFGGYPDIKLAAPSGGPTALVNTWALGRLKAGAQRTFRFEVTAVKAGPYEIAWRVNAGLQGKAKAIGADDAPPRGKFFGTVTDKPPASRVAADGVTVVSPTP
jgi:hypothetical protein